MIYMYLFAPVINNYIIARSINTIGIKGKVRVVEKGIFFVINVDSLSFSYIFSTFPIFPHFLFLFLLEDFFARFRSTRFLRTSPG